MPSRFINSFRPLVSVASKTRKLENILPALLEKKLPVVSSRTIALANGKRADEVLDLLRKERLGLQETTNINLEQMFSDLFSAEVNDEVNQSLALAKNSLTNEWRRLFNSPQTQKVHADIANEQLMLWLSGEVNGRVKPSDVVDLVRRRALARLSKLSKTTGPEVGIDKYTTPNGVEFTELLARLASCGLHSVVSSCVGHPSRHIVVGGEKELRPGFVRFRVQDSPCSNKVLDDIRKLGVGIKGFEERAVFVKPPRRFEFRFHPDDRDRFWSGLVKIADKHSRDIYSL